MDEGLYSTRLKLKAWNRSDRYPLHLRWIKCLETHYFFLIWSINTPDAFPWLDVLALLVKSPIMGSSPFLDCVLRKPFKFGKVRDSSHWIKGDIVISIPGDLQPTCTSVHAIVTLFGKSRLGGDFTSVEVFPFATPTLKSSTKGTFPSRS